MFAMESLIYARNQEHFFLIITLLIIIFSVPKEDTPTTFENHLNPVMLVFIGSSSLSPLR